MGGMKAVFLGSFDPPTNGHLHLISEALSHGASEVIMVPAFHNPWKKDQTPYLHRVEMCKMVPFLYPPAKVTVLEAEKMISEGHNLESIPTWMVLKELKNSLGDFKILTTNETYLEIPKWSKGEEILKEYEFMIFSSSHFGREIPGSIEIIPLPISSTLVREKLQNGIPCPEYIPAEAMKYIKTNKLYEKISIYN